MAESRDRLLVRKGPGVLVRDQWIAIHELAESPDLRRGWVRKAGASALVTLTKEDHKQLRREALEKWSGVY